MSHQFYFLHTETDIPVFFKTIYEKGGNVFLESGECLQQTEITLLVQEQMRLPNGCYYLSNSSVFNKERGHSIELTHPVFKNGSKSDYISGRLYLSPDDNWAYDKELLHLYQKIKRYVAKQYLYDRLSSHYYSPSFLTGYINGEKLPYYFYGVPAPIGEDTIQKYFSTDRSISERPLNFPKVNAVDKKVKETQRAILRVRKSPGMAIFYYSSSEDINHQSD